MNCKYCECEFERELVHITLPIGEEYDFCTTKCMRSYLSDIGFDGEFTYRFLSLKVVG